MTNALPRFELFLLGEGEKLVDVIEDTKIPNAATIKIMKQDHTLANMMRGYLLKNPKVLFAGYKVPHPLDPHFILKIQTDGSATPVEVLSDTCSQLLILLQTLEKKFKEQFLTRELDIPDQDEPYASSAAAPTQGPYGVETRRRAADYLDFS